MPSVSSETSVIKVTQWFHSERLDENLWRDDPRYLFCIPPRISKYATTADDAAIQCQIDIAGIKNIGFFDGSLSTIGGFTALVHPETLPERVAAVSYLTEFLGYYDDIESPEPDEISIEPSQFSVRKQLSIQDSAWKLRSKTAFSKALSSIHDIDPILGGEVLQAWQDWRLADKHLNDHFDEYKGLDEYLQDRIIDLAWGPSLATALFGANITLSEAEEASGDHVIAPLLEHGVYINDYFSWDKEHRAYREHGIPIRSSINLLMHHNNLALDDARLLIKNKILALSKEYLGRKNEFLLSQGDGISPSVRKWIEVVELMEAGHSVWMLHAYRYNATGGDGYREYYSKRTTQGARWSAVPSL